GHEKGAFTGAVSNHRGRFEKASEGTLFLDEIGNLSMPLQAKLLTAIERRQVIRLGANHPIPIDIRLIAATNQPIHEKVADGIFREDLLYRINTVELQLPPLRQRGHDILLLAQHFLEQYCNKYQHRTKTLNAASREKLLTYQWPGNVRELQHAIERAVIMSESQTLSPADILLAPRKKKGSELPLDEFKLDEIEKLAIQRALKKHQGNISKAARELGLTRTSLYRRLEKYGL
ncbi:sigma-54-dependent Fis family transcriptional regulator, partial [bacterium]|nr:sigma-54-dependent Fis family transcriptional regulator [bacterium]